jgi:hypothetical protein
MMLPVIVLLALAPAEPPGDSPEVKKLLGQRVAALKKAFEAKKAELLAGRGTAAEMIEVTVDLANAELELASTPAKKREILLRILKAAVETDGVMLARYEAGRATTAEFYKARAFRLKAEINLRRAGGTPPKDIKPPKEPKEPKIDDPNR